MALPQTMHVRYGPSHVISVTSQHALDMNLCDAEPVLIGLQPPPDSASFPYEQWNDKRHAGRYTQMTRCLEAEYMRGLERRMLKRTTGRSRLGRILLGRQNLETKELIIAFIFICLSGRIKHCSPFLAIPLRYFLVYLCPYELYIVSVLWSPPFQFSSGKRLWAEIHSGSFQSDMFLLLLVAACESRHRRLHRSHCKRYFQRPPLLRTEAPDALEEVHQRRPRLRRVSRQELRLPDGVRSTEKYVDDHGGRLQVEETKRSRRTGDSSFVSHSYSSVWTSGGRDRRR